MPDGLVNVVTQDGDTIGVTPEEAQKLIETRGARLQTPAEAQLAAEQGELEEQFTTPEQQFRALGLGGLRGFSFGLSDLVLGGEEAGMLREFNPGPSLLGEATGIIGGGVGAFGKGLTARVLSKTPAGLAARAAHGAGQRAGGKALGAVVEGAVEGGLFGTGQAVSEAALTDDPLTVESIVAGTGFGALFGGAAGGALGLGAKALKRTRKIDDLAELGAPVGQYVKDIDSAAGEALKGADELVRSNAANYFRKRAGRAGVEVAEEIDTAAESPLARRADDEQLELFGAQQGELPFRRPSTAIRGKGRAERRRFERGLKKGRGKPQAPRGTQQELDLGPTPAQQLDLFDEPALVARQADEFAEAPPTPAAPREEFLPPGAVEMGDEVVELRAAVDAARKAYKSARGKVVKDLGDDFALDLGHLIRRKPKDALRVVQNIDELEKSVRAIDELAGTKFTGELTGDALLSRLTSELPEAGEEAIRKLNALDGVVIADVLGLDVSQIPAVGPAADTVLKLYALGRVASAKTTHKLVSNLADMAFGGGRAALVRHAFRKNVLAGGAVSYASRGNPFEIVNGIAARTSAMQDKVGTLTRKAVKAMSKPGLRPAALATAQDILANVQFDPVKEEGDEVKARVTELARATTDEERTRRFLDERLAPIRAVNLQAGYEATEVALNGLRFLRTKMPNFTKWGLMSEGKPPASQVASFARYVRAVKNPLVLLEDLADGSLTVETVEAVKMVYPAIYQRVQVELVDQLSELREELPYQSRLRLTTFFEVPVEPTAAPEVIHGLQSVYQMKAQSPAGIRPSRGVPGPLPGAEPTKGQRMSER